MAQKNTCIIFLAENGNVITTSKSTLTPFGGPKTQVLLKKKSKSVYRPQDLETKEMSKPESSERNNLPPCSTDKRLPEQPGS